MRATKVVCVWMALALWCARVHAQDQVIEITEEAPEIEATASERSVDQARISVAPKRSGDDLLELVPGLLVSSHGAEGKARQVFLRGFDAVHGADLELTLAGIPLNEMSNVHGQGYLDLGFVIPETILGMTALKGPFRLDQGNFATAGSARFELGVAEADRGARASYELGSSLRQRALAIIAPRRMAEQTFLAVEAMRDDGFGENRGAERTSAVGQLRAGTLDLLAVAYAARFGEPGVLPLEDVASGAIGELGSTSPDTEGSSSRALAGVRHRARGLELLAYGGARRLELEENFTGFLLDEARGDRRRQHHEAAGGGARAELTRKVARGLRLVGGADVHVERFAQREDGIDADHEIFRHDRDLDGWQLGGGVRAGASYAPDPFRLEGGLRLDAFHFRVEDHLGARAAEGTMAALSPRLAASVRLGRRLTIFASYGRGLRAPEARSVLGDEAAMPVEGQLYRGGEPAVTAADSVELGGRWLGERLSATASGFATFVEHELVFDHLSGVNAEVNATRRLGVELGVEARPWRWLELRGDATAVDARFVDSGAPIPGTPTLLATLEAAARHASGLRGGARLTILGRRPLGEGAEAGAGATLDLVAAHRFSRFQVELAVDNVLDNRVPDGVYHFASWFDRQKPRSGLPRIHISPGPPLTLRLGLSMWL